VHRFGIRTLLVAFAVAVILPGFLVGGLILAALSHAEEKMAKALILQSSRANLMAVDQKIGDIEDQLRTSVDPDAPGAGDLGQFSSTAAAMAAQFDGSSITLFSKDGTELATTNTLAAAAPADEINTVKETAATGRPSVSSVFSSDIGEIRMVAIAEPTGHEADRRILQIALPARQFEETLREGNLPKGGVVALFDQRGALIARFPPRREQAVDAQGSDLGDSGPHEDANFANGKFEGISLTGAFSRSQLSGWAVGVGVATDVVGAPYRRLLAWLFGAGAFVTLVGGYLAWRFAHHMAQSILSLTAAAETLGEGGVPATPDGSFREIRHMGQRLREAARLLEDRATERDQALERLRRTNLSLEDRVQLRTRELAESNRRLSDETEHRRKAEEALGQRRKMEALGQLTAGIAHDFNNLLTPIIGNLEIIKTGKGRDKTKDLAARALSAAELGASLTQQLLAFGRRQRLEKRVVDVNSLVVSVLPLLREAVGPLIELDTHLAQGTCGVAVDQAQMESALLNLAVNGRDAMPTGGRFSIETQWLHAEDGHPHVGPGDWAVITAKDTGVGMSSDVLARVFEPFYTTKPPGEGSGLGLSMVYGLVKQLEGEISVSSMPGRGTSVAIYLPKSAAGPISASPSPLAASSDVSGARILVVDDNPEVLGFMADVLIDAGCDVVQASNGAMAIDRLRDPAGFDLVLIDYAMPGMSGTMTAQAMRSRGLDVPILLTTGLADAIDPGEWPEQDILHKPFRQAGLLNKIQDLMRRAPV
jgi:signal transduction histidine kinase